MPFTTDVIDITGYPLLPLEKNAEGIYPFPRQRYGILPYYVNDKNEIVWGCIESNRVEPITFEPAAGTQDIIAIKDDQRLVLDVGKPLPIFNHDLNYLHQYTGQLFRDKTYQDMISCLVTSGFSVYLECPLATAIHEAYDEHGIDFRNHIGQDIHLLKTPFETVQYALLPPEVGVASSLGLWLPELTKPEGIVLRYTDKIEEKMSRNLGRKFYEKGVWITLDYYKSKLLEEESKFSSLTNYSLEKASLINDFFRASYRTMRFIEQFELLLLKKQFHEPLENKVFNNQNVFFNSLTNSKELEEQSIMLTRTFT